MNEAPRAQPPLDLANTIASAANEAQRQLDQQAAQKIQAELATQRRALQRRLLMMLVLCLAAPLAWWVLQVPRPSRQDLAQGQQTLLDLASQTVQDHLQSTGQVPTDLQTLLPAAAKVSIQTQEQTVVLTLSDELTAPATRRVALPASPTAPR